MADTLSSPPRQRSGGGGGRILHCQLAVLDSGMGKSKNELDGAEFYKKLQCARDGYVYFQTANHQQDDGEAY